MFTDTRDKLLEARYFLERMKAKQSETDAFKYNLSAFLAAARSVTLVMQTEFNKMLGFKQWYAGKQVKIEGDNAMRLLNDKRVMTIHQQPVRPHAHINIMIGEHVTIGESISIVLTRADGTVERSAPEPTPPPTQLKSEVKTEWRWYFGELPEKDVVTACKEHMAKLETLVAECESQFASKKSAPDTSLGLTA